MEPWYKNTVPRAEVREGRSFNPDEFAIALEQVAANKGPDDYRDPAKFFSRTCFTRALREHMGMVLRRLAGRTDNSETSSSSQLKTAVTVTCQSAAGFSCSAGMESVATTKSKIKDGRA